MKAILLLGSNQNNPIEQLTIAIEHVSELFILKNKSSVYITAAWGNTEQADFYNQAIEIEFNISENQLMSKLIDIERLMGRERVHKWEPRIIDLDIISIDNLCIDEENLTVPHPYMQERMFVLIPFKELNPNWLHPILKKNIDELISSCTDNLAVHKFSIE